MAEALKLINDIAKNYFAMIVILFLIGNTVLMYKIHEQVWMNEANTSDMRYELNGIKDAIRNN